MAGRRGSVSWTTLAFVLAAAVYVKNAWVSEDAYIVFRSVEQLFAGRGPVWNPHERVQVFTSPLWFGLLAGARLVTTDLFTAAVVLGGGLWLATLAVLRSLAGTPGRFLLLVAGLIAANGVVDFASSGLETGLLLLLAALVVRSYFGAVSAGAAGTAAPGPDPGRHLTVLWLAAGLVLVTRHDHVFLVAPAVAAATWRRRPLGAARVGRLLLAGLGPLAVWTVFAVVFYGFPLPNTAYAKLGTGIPAAVVIRQGLKYLCSAAGLDTIVVVVLGAFVWWGWRERRAAPLWAGVVLQLAYVVAVGGDFMLSRFLIPTYVVAAGAAVALRGADLVRRRALWIGLAAYAVLYLHTPINVPVRYPTPPIRLGVADERGIYCDVLTLWDRLAAHRTGRPFPDMSWHEEGTALRAAPPPVAVAANIGVLGYAAGTEATIVDPLALSDPFLARLPVTPPWRVGHYARTIPDGYLASLADASAPPLDDPRLEALRADLALITRSSALFAPERWRAILRRNLGSGGAGNE